MNNESFVKAIKIAVTEASASGIIEELKKPIGRRPSSKSVKRSEWFERLTSEDRQMVVEVVNLTAKRTTFGFLAVLDNVRAIEAQGAKGDIELTFIKDGGRAVLNDPSQEPLHDIFNRGEG